MATARSRRSAVVAALVAGTLVIALIISGTFVGSLKSVGRVVVAPFAFTINLVARPVANLVAGAVNYTDVVRQNQQLRAELGIATQLANQADAMKRQLAELTTVLHLPFVGSIPTEVAQVVTNSPTNFVATVSISKGRSDGVLVGMPVVANGGLVGMVSATSAHASTVRLITDQTNIVGATFGNGKSNVLIYGRGVNNALTVSSVTLASPVSTGTVLATNGLRGGIYPPGIPVARVTTATLTPGSATWNLQLRPSADLVHLHYVQVMLWEPST